MRESKYFYDLLNIFWYNKNAKVILPLISFGASFLGLYLTGKNMIENIIFSFLLSAVILIIWQLNNMIPKAKKGKSGFIISIYFEKPEYEIKFKNDFIEVIKDLLRNKPVSSLFDVLVYNNYQSSKVNIDNSTKHLNKSNAIFILFGNLKVRSGKNNKNKYILKLTAGVKHIQIPQEFSNVLSKDFSRLMKYEFEVPFENEHQHFEMQANMIHMVAKYMVGIASYISFNFDYSISLFEDLKISSNYKVRYKDNNVYKKVISNINKTLPDNLFNMYSAKADALYLKWITSRDIKLINDISTIVYKALSIKPNDYRFINYQAICIYLLEENVEKAIKTISRNRKEKDAAWLICRAFLYGHKGDLQSAFTDYMQATEFSNIEQSIPIQTEQFILEVLEKHPELKHLRFNLGVINYYFKQDYRGAKTELLLFVEQSDEIIFKKQKLIAEDLIKEIDNKLISDI